MSNLIGQSFGRYHILEQLGEGGMAVVYKAYDTRLETDVAIKVIRTENILPSVMERALKRFEREAKALARLTHPNIVKVTDYGEYEGKPYLVMPYFPGGTLKEKIGKQIPWREALQILLPIAEALDYAHSQKMIHRDVKPSNILLTQSGQPMLTDFGIAKILDLEETLELTGTSAAIGTPEYMAPEQATAKSVDHRADIYSFGVVLYEMLIGRKPYTADTPMAILIMHAHDPLPNPKTYVPDLPDEVERILLKALAKKPEDRYQSMGEMTKAFENLQRDGSKQPALKMTSKSKLTIKPNILMIILGLVALALLAVFGLPPLIGKPEPTQQARLEPKDTTIPPSTRTPAPILVSTLALTRTPNPLELGERLELCGSDLCVVNGQGKRTSLKLSPNYAAFQGYSWSPDGSRIAFVACSLEDIAQSIDCHGDMFIVNKDGSNVVPIRVGPAYTLNLSWSPDGQWFAVNENGTLTIIRSDGQASKVLVRGNIAMPWATAWSPDSQRIAWVGGICDNNANCTSDRVWVINRDGSDMQVLLDSPNLPILQNIGWSPDGEAVAVTLSNGTTYLIDANCKSGTIGCDEASRAEINGIPQDWLHTFRPQWLNANTKPTSTPNTSEQEETLTMCNDDLCIVSGDGSSLRIGLSKDYDLRDFGASWSPDGTRFIFSACLRNAGMASECIPDLFIANRDGSNVTPVIINPNSHDNMPIWSPDGQWIAYGNNGGVAIVRPDGTGKTELVKGGSVCPFGIAWSPDSRQIAFQGGDGNCTQPVIHDSVWALNADGANRRRILQGADPRLVVKTIAWSPDGQSVVVMQEDGKGLLINANCVNLPAGCDESSRTKLDSFPKDWLATFHPQWMAEPSLKSPSVTLTLPSPGKALASGSQIITVGTDSAMELARVDPNGTQTLLTNNDAFDGHAAISPDGRRVAFWSDRDGGANIYVMNTDGTNVIRVTNDENSYDPSWMPDGNLFYVAGGSALKLLDIVSGKTTTIASFPYGISVPELTSDKSQIIFLRQPESGPWWTGKAYVMPVEGGAPELQNRNISVINQTIFPWSAFQQASDHYLNNH